MLRVRVDLTATRELQAFVYVDAETVEDAEKQVLADAQAEPEDVDWLPGSLSDHISVTNSEEVD